MRTLILFLLSTLLTHTTVLSQVRVWQWNNLGTIPQSTYDQAMRQSQGVVGMDALFPEISKIGMTPVSVETFGNRPTHRPIDGFKRAHTGILGELFKMTPGIIQDDDDICLYIFPNPGDRLFEDYLATGKTKQNNVEGEIDVNTAFAASIFTNGPKLFTQITGFGPWVHEKHNYWDTHPHDYLEMHPCENMWWTDLSGGRYKYTMGVFSDNSGRFTKWRPNPVIALNAIAFERQGSRPLTYAMQVLTSLHMVPYPLFNDNATEHYLMDGTDTIVVIKEAASPNIHFSIDFASVSRQPLGNGKFRYTGFIKIHSAVKDGGHSIFSVRQTTGSVAFKSAEVKVTLQSIRCVALDDEGSTEELYGAYGVSAVTGMSPFHANLYTPGTTNGILWQRHHTNTLNLKKGQTSIINGVRTFTIPATGELVLYGDINEEDKREGNDNDRLGEVHIARFLVRNLKTGPPLIITQQHRSGGSVIEVKLSIEKKETQRLDISDDPKISF